MRKSKRFVIFRVCEMINLRHMFCEERTKSRRPMNDRDRQERCCLVCACRFGQNVFLPAQEYQLEWSPKMRRIILPALCLIMATPAIAGLSPRDRKACVRAVVKATHNDIVTVLGAEESEANETVYIGVGKQKAKWKCLVKRGVVAEVSSMVDEGAL
jgi:hypothetical protein